MQGVHCPGYKGAVCSIAAAKLQTVCCEKDAGARRAGRLRRRGEAIFAPWYDEANLQSRTIE